MAWYCPKCTAETLPFHCSDDNGLFIENGPRIYLFPDRDLMNL